MAYDQGYADALREIRELKEKLAKARDALRPFAEFHPSLLLWRHSARAWPLKESHPRHQPVIENTYPIDIHTERVCRLFVSDFERAVDVLAGADNKEQ
ncbi:hypothetical protein D3C71_1626970 [compost metagenome]